MIKTACFATASLRLLAGCSSPPSGETSAADSAPATTASAMPAAAPETEVLCTNFGPQTPRDISSAAGTNADAFPMAPAYTELNLCNERNEDTHDSSRSRLRSGGCHLQPGSIMDGGLIDPLSGFGSVKAWRLPVGFSALAGQHCLGLMIGRAPPLGNEQ